MPGNSFGTSFCITTAGESHGPANVVIIDGCPPGLALSEEDLVHDLVRRRPGQSKLVSQRNESDTPEILSGVFEGKTTGTSIAILIRNQDARSKDYSDIKDKYRPGHADHSFDAKYGFRDYRGGGRSSARETVARVAAGAVAKKLLREWLNVQVVGYVTQIGDVIAQIPDPSSIEEASVEFFKDGTMNPVRCPDHAASKKMIALIDKVRKEQDSIGGIAELCATGVPAGLGEPVFDKLKADFAKALFSIPAVIGVEYGSGFSGALERGSVHNDRFVMRDGQVATESNRHGGMLGGISSGMPIVLRAALKATSSLSQEQDTVTRDGKSSSIATKGRHDPCLLPRFVPIAEAMVALVLADHWLRWRGQCGV
ncbi:MAG: chorismate synthase [Myxococcales bacterium]|nr:MAG: chorismate synthase [Myxococcales bacterium]